jgi:hypothetical protein
VNKLLRRLLGVAITIALLSPVFLQAGPRSRLLNEDAALSLLLRTLKQNHVYEHRISRDCVTFETEETTTTYFQFVLRENHTAKCGGDPDVSPVVDRYRVYRSSGKLERYDAVKDSWQRYKPA